MHSDSYFTKGKTHKVCQDYAAAGDSKDWPHSAYAIVSDGCSSSPDTDIGARRMVLWGLKELIYTYSSYIDWPTVAREAKPDCDLLDPTCIDATLLTLRQCDSMDVESTGFTEKTIFAQLAGDGVLAARHRDGRLRYWVISYEPGEGGVAPAYPSYLNDKARFDQYLALGHGVTTITEYLNGEPEPFFASKRKQVYAKWTGDGWENIDICWEIELDSDEYDFVAVLSDGAESFYTKNSSGQTTSVPLYDVLQQVMAIKNSKGQFVTRRCQRFFESHCVKNGWEHYDDFSMAAIWCREG
jgi:hypothetical protein